MTSRHLTALTTLGLLTLLVAGANAEEIHHSFFVAGPTFTGIIDEAGKPV